MTRLHIGTAAVILTGILGASVFVHAQTALPTIHVNATGQLPTGECQPNDKSGYPPDSSIRSPMSYTEKGKKKQSLLGKSCKGTVPPKGVAVRSECRQDYANTGKCACVEWKDQQGNWQKCDASKLPKSVSPSDSSSAKSEDAGGSSTKPDQSSSAATTQKAGSETTPKSTTQSPTTAKASGGDTGASASKQSTSPGPHSSILSSALNPTPIAEQKTGLTSPTLKDAERQLFSPDAGAVANTRFETLPAGGAGGGAARPVSPIAYRDPSIASIPYQPPTESFSAPSSGSAPPVNSFVPDNTFAKAYPGSATGGAADPCTTVVSCADAYVRGAYDAVAAVARGAGGALADAFGIGGAESAPFDRTALGSIDKTTRAFADVYGMQEGDAPQIAKAIAGACAQEAGGCNPNVKHPGSDYQGLPQTDKAGMKENANTFKFFATNEYIAMSDESRDQFKYLSNRYDAVVAAGKDPRKEPDLGGAMITAQQFNVKDKTGQGGGFAPALIAADYARGQDGVIDPQKAAAVIQTAQICPSCVSSYSRDPNATLDKIQAGVLSTKANAVPVKEGQPIADAFDAMLSSTKAYGPTFAKGIDAQTLAMANPSPKFIEPQLAYTMGNVGATQYPSALAYASADARGGSSVPFPGSQGTGSGSDYSNPSIAYRMPENLGRSTFSRPLSSGFTAPSSAFPSASAPSVPLNTYFSNGLQLSPTYAPYSGGSLPVFAQGSVPSQVLGGISGGNSQTPTFAAGGNTGAPALNTTQYRLPSGFGGSYPSAYGQLGPSTYPAAQFAQQTPGTGYNPGVAPVSASQYFKGNLQLTGPTAPATQSGYTYTDPIARPYSMNALQQPQSPPVTGGSAQAVQQALAYKNPVPYQYSMNALQPSQSPSLQQALAYKNPLLYPYSMNGLPTSAQPSYAPYSGGPLPVFAQGSVPSQALGGISGGSPSAPAFTGQSFYAQPTAPASAPYAGGSLPVFAQGSVPSQALGGISGGNSQTPTFAGGAYGNGINTTQYTLPPGLGGSTQGAYGQLGPAPSAQPSAPTFAPYAGGPTPLFAQGSVPSQVLGGISGGNSQTPTFAAGGNTGAPALNTTQYRLPDTFGGSYQNAYGQLQSSPPAAGADRVSPDLAYQYAQQETARVQARDYAASLYDQTLRGQSASMAISPSSGMWSRYMDIGAAELGKPTPVASAEAPTSPSRPGDFLPSDAPLPPSRPSDFSPAPFQDNMGFGARGSDVKALQQRLIDEGYLKLVHGPSGYYGLLTQNAVIRYQRDHGVLQTGFTGPVTRCNLNGGTYYSSSASCRY